MRIGRFGLLVGLITLAAGATVPAARDKAVREGRPDLLRRGVPSDHPPKRAKATHLDDYAQVHEGGREPSLGKTVRVLIVQDHPYIVFLDEQYYVEWACADDYKPCSSAAVLNRVARLESAGRSYFGQSELVQYERLIGEGLARDIGDHDAKAAQEALDDAQNWILSKAWLRYLVASFIVTVMLLLALGLSAWSFQARPDIFDVLLGASTAVLGAFASMLLRLGGAHLAFANVLTVYVDGSTRIFAAALGGALVVGAVKADIVFGTAKQSRALLLVLCAVGGASERFVPGLVGQIEAAFPVKVEASSTTTTTLPGT